jgi:hypothetical protein
MLSFDNIVYTFFIDEEDLFMVCDLLAGGDLRYHLTQKVNDENKNNDKLRVIFMQTFCT